MARQVLFVHGAPGDARTWEPVIDALPEYIDARAITLSYFGPNEWIGDGSDFGTELHRDDIVHYIDAEMAKPVDLVAWSFGCHPALLAAIERPELFASVTLYEPSLPTYVRDPDALRRFVLDSEAAFPPVAAALKDRGAEAAMALILDNAGGDGYTAKLNPHRRKLYLDSARVLPLLMGQGRSPTEISADDLGRIACPVTIAMGENTRAMFEVPSRAAAEAMIHGRLVAVKNADHMLPEKEPVRFAALIAELLGSRKA